MQAADQSQGCIRFEGFELDLRSGELRPIAGENGAKPIRLAEQPFLILTMLLGRPGQVVTREEIRKRLWPNDTIVEFEHSISAAMNRLRQALGDSAESPRYIETLARRGYRWMVPVHQLENRQAAVRTPPLQTGVTASVLRLRRRPLWLAGSLAVILGGLAVAWFLLRHPAQPTVELAQKRLTFNPRENPVQSATISPDGKYLAYSDPAGIHVKLLSTGDERLIPKPVGAPANVAWRVASWFPDGTQLLADRSEPGGQSSMWAVPVLGQSARELREGTRGWEVSPDGTLLAFGPSAESGHIHELWVIGSLGENPHKVLSLGENEFLGDVHWSPDGQRLAYLRLKPTGDEKRPLASIETCDLKGAKRTVVLSDLDAGASPWSFCWLRDRRIVYRRWDSADSGEDNLWQVGVNPRTGTPTGKPSRITYWAGSDLWALSASADGKRLALVKATYQAQVYLGALTAGGTRMNPPRLLTNAEASDVPFAWTPDSKAVLFLSDRNLAGKLFALEGNGGIFKQGVGQDSAEPIAIGTQNAYEPRLSADGAWILYGEAPRTAVGPSTQDRLMRIPVGGGVPQLVLEMQRDWDHRCARAPASLCVVFESSQDEKRLIVTAFDPVKGRGKVLRTMPKDPNLGCCALSPDGTTFQISGTGEAEIHLRLLSLSGGSDREITVKGWPNATGADWSPDGKGLYVGSVSPQASTLLYVDLEGNARVLWQIKGGSETWGIPSPDGRYLAIMGDVANSNVWMLENF